MEKKQAQPSGSGVFKKSNLVGFFQRLQQSGLAKQSRA